MELQIRGNTVTRFESSWLRDVPIVLWGSGGQLDATGSTLGPLLLDTLFANPFRPGPSVSIRDSTLDLPGSPFELWVRRLDPPPEPTAGIAFISRDSVDPGSVAILGSRIVSDESIDHPILYVSERDPTGRIVVDEEGVEAFFRLE